MRASSDLMKSTSLAASHAAELCRVLDAVRRAADPAAGVARAWGSVPALPKVRVLAAGKAALPMAREAGRLLGDRAGGGLIVTPEADPAPDAQEPGSPGVGGEPGEPQGWHLLITDHPHSTERNRRAALEAEAFARACPRDQVLLMLISGGASAQLASPQPGLELQDLDALYANLRRAGAAIGELNAVRKHCERLKGGRLAAVCPATVHVLVLSDVLGDPLDVIASGPAAPDPTTYADAMGVLERIGLSELAPSPAILDHLRRGMDGELPETPKHDDPVFDRVTHVIVGSNRIAVDAAEQEARAMGFKVDRQDSVEGEAMEAGARLAHRVHASAGSPRCVLMGGEATVRVGSDRSGRGGPSQETALAASIALDGVPIVRGLAYSTDGIDGESANAGAVFTGRTIEAASARGLDAAIHLRRHESAGFFEALGDALKTRATGTNVNHVACVLVGDP